MLGSYAVFINAHSLFGNIDFCNDLTCLDSGRHSVE